MQKFLFGKVEIWLVLLVLILGAIGTIGFSAIVLDQEREQNHFGALGRVALAVAAVPEDLRQIIRRKEAMQAIRPARFAGQPSGWTFAADGPAIAGYLLLSRHDGTLKHHVVELVSLRDGAVLHRWAPSAGGLLADAPRTSLIADYTSWNDRNYRIIHPLLLEDGSLIIKDHQNYAMRIDSCGQRMWLQDRLITHHSTEDDGANGFWVPGLIEPATIEGVEPGWYEDALVHMDTDGKIISIDSLPQILLDNDRRWALFNASHRQKDPVHLNDIEPVLADGPYWKKGDLFLSLRHTSEILLYRPSSRKIVWSRQAPWLAQHDIDILDDHRISVFDNQAYDRGNGARVDGANRVVIYDFALDRVTGPWDAALAALKVETLSEGLQTILPDGSLMVEEENSGRILFLGPAGDVRATFLNTIEDGTAYRLGWSRWIDPALGALVLDRIGGVTCDLG